MLMYRHKKIHRPKPVGDPGDVEPPGQTRRVVDILLHCLDGWKRPDMGVPGVSVDGGTPKWLVYNGNSC